MNTITPILAVSNRLRQTPFTQRIVNDGASAFTVYNHMLLPTEFDGLEFDYWHLCTDVQVWDVGAERQVSISGPDAQKLVQWMTPRDISQVEQGRCVYTPLADPRGFLLNDPISLKLADDHWWLSVADSDVWLWANGLAAGAGLNVQIEEPDVWPLAVQGPKADLLMRDIFGIEVDTIRFFRFKPLKFKEHEFNVARSGWSKQGGFEIYVDDAELGVELYDALMLAGKQYNVRPGCPNLIERMESGLLSFGNDMTAAHTVLECGFTKFISLDSDIDSLSIQALRAQRDAGLKRMLKGLVFAADDNSCTIKDHPANSIIYTSSGQPIGRMGTQVWSPRHKMHLATVMLEENFMHCDEIEISLNCETSDSAIDYSSQIESVNVHSIKPEISRFVMAKVTDIPFDFASLD